MSDDRYMTAREAADYLGITRATLYAYVSRGLVRSEETAASSRARRYRRVDVEALRRQRAVRRNPAQAAAEALHFGAPVLASAITLIANGRLYYRGHDVLALARNVSFEAVATLIWRGSLTNGTPFPAPPPKIRLPAAAAALPAIARFQLALPLAAAADVAAYDRRPAAAAATGARIVALLAETAAGRPAIDGVAAALQQAWAPDRPAAAALINAALILCADHELNVSSFTARCVASAAATPYGVVLAGLAALQGARHGGYTERVEALFAEAGGAAGGETAVVSRLRRGETIPGFGHPLYPKGDPRARLLLELVAESDPDAPALALARATAAAVRQSVGQLPTLDFGLVTLARALRLPDGAALALFALGRTAGWVGHAIEEYGLDRLIRPRARYIGVQPPES